MAYSTRRQPRGNHRRWTFGGAHGCSEGGAESLVWLIRYSLRTKVHHVTESFQKRKPAEKAEAPRCRCGAQPTLVRKMMNPTQGTTVRMLECRCGERAWS